jgi:hypothetical protein
LSRLPELVDPEPQQLARFANGEQHAPRREAGGFHLTAKPVGPAGHPLDLGGQCLQIQGEHRYIIAALCTVS